MKIFTPTQRKTQLHDERHAVMEIISTATRKLIHAQKGPRSSSTTEQIISDYIHDCVFHSETIAHHAKKLKRINIDLEFIYQAQQKQNNYICSSDPRAYTERDHESYLGEVQRLVETLRPSLIVATEITHFANSVVHETRNLTKLPL